MVEEFHNGDSGYSFENRAIVPAILVISFASRLDNIRVCLICCLIALMLLYIISKK